MGRCQTGFCLARTIPLLAEALGVDEEEIVKSGNGAYYIEGKIKDSL